MKPVQRILGISLICIMTICLPVVRILAGETPPTLATAVDSIGMTVSDMDRSVEFYSKVLPFEKVSDVEVWGEDYEHLQGVFGLRMRIVRMRLGGEWIELTEYLTPKGRPMPLDSRSHDRWFQHIAIVVRDMEAAYQHLRAHHVQHVSTTPQRLPDSNTAAAGVKAFYFRDPDGHNLELIFFPPGKGDPKWQGTMSPALPEAAETAPVPRGDKLFLGIDHTALAVHNTETSLKFYRDLLGFKVVGESVNYGTEQEHLANVFGARVHITGIRSSGGTPGIEFLEYLTPRDGRPMSGDVQANDIMQWQTTLIADDVEAAAQRLSEAKHTFQSSRVVRLPQKRLGFIKGLMVRDPDGHAIRLIEK